MRQAVVDLLQPVWQAYLQQGVLRNAKCNVGILRAEVCQHLQRRHEPELAMHSFQVAYRYSYCFMIGVSAAHRAGRQATACSFVEEHRAKCLSSHAIR